jgi:proteasome accessory factor B
MERLATRTSRIRQIEELLLVVPSGMKATDIADQLDVNRRTVYRDLDFLSEQGVPVWQENGRFGINRTRYLSTVHLSFHEATALVMAGLLLSRTIDERNSHVITALRKVAATLPYPLCVHLIRAAERVQTQEDGYRQVQVLETISEAWGNGQKVEVGYRSPRSDTLYSRVLSPYALEPTSSGIYVICYDDWAEDMRTFKLDRLETAVLCDEFFDIPEEFDLEEHLANSWGIMTGDEVTKVSLRFLPHATSHVHERQWHPSQRIELLEDGGCLLHVEIAEPVEMLPWIRGWGPQVEVLSPVWLRQQVADDLHQAVALYN